MAIYMAKVIRFFGFTYFYILFLLMQVKSHHLSRARVDILIIVFYSRSSCFPRCLIRKKKGVVCQKWVFALN